VTHFARLVRHPRSSLGQLALHDRGPQPISARAPQSSATAKQQA
jgi:hypothetical protein